MPTTTNPPTDSDSAVLLIAKAQASELRNALASVLASARRDPGLSVADAETVDGFRTMLGRIR